MSTIIPDIEYERLACRIEQAMIRSTHDWHPGDELEYRNLLPAGRSPKRLPDPKQLREAVRAARGGIAHPLLLVLPEGYRTWTQILLHLDGLAHRNDPRNPHRMMRDLARGKFPLR